MYLLIVNISNLILKISMNICIKIYIFFNSHNGPRYGLHVTDIYIYTNNVRLYPSTVNLPIMYNILLIKVVTVLSTQTPNRKIS
jgi:hypothetical protein